MKKYLGLLAILAISACKKDSPNPTTPSAEEKGYFPLTVGSRWTYDSPTGPFTSTVKSEVNLLGARYRVVFETQDSLELMMRRSGDTVYSTLGIGNPSPFLIEGAAAGAEWDTDFSFFTYHSKIVSKGITRTVKGKSYSDVMHVKMTNSVSTSEQDAYYAKGVGRIELIEDGESIEQLVSYEIK